MPELVEKALTDQRDSETDETVREHALNALIEHPSREVFETARRLCESADQNERKLGIRVLRELGRPDRASVGDPNRNERPFAKEAVPMLLRLLEQESDSEMLVWTISALGYQWEPEALPALWERARHPHSEVRYAVCGAISSAAPKSGIDDTSIDVLCVLSRDRNPRVRFSATFELVAWQEEGVDDPRITEALERASHDKHPLVARALMRD